MLLEGLHLPLTTPFHPDGRLNSAKLAANVIRYSKTPASGLIALAPSGEPTLLDDAETREVLATIAQSAASEKVLLANISRDSLRHTLALAEYAANALYDAVLVAPPRSPVQGDSPEQQRQTNLFFQMVADRSPLPVVLLSTTHQPLAASLAHELTHHANIVGLLSSTPLDGKSWLAAAQGVSREVTVTMVFTAVTARMQRDAAKAAPESSSGLVSAASLARNPAAAATAVADPPPAMLLRTRTRAVAFQIIAGVSAQLLDALDAGATAIAPAFAACAPQACYEVYAAWKDGDHALAAEKQHRLLSAARFAETLGPGGLKAGCDLNGYFGGVPRLPALPASATQRIELEHLMESIRN